MSEGRDFGDMGRSYQERVVQLLFEDNNFAEMMMDVVLPRHFTYGHLQELVRILVDHRNRYKAFPSLEVALIQLRQGAGADDPAVMMMAAEFFKRTQEVPLGGDRPYIEESSLEFCKRQTLIAAVGKCLEQIEGKKYDAIAGTIREALDKGSPRDHGHDYHEQLERRAEQAVRDPISTGWQVLDRYLNGGWERKTIVTFIAPTGAGKSMFLVNCACALVEQGLNVLYVTLEMADYKIGLRADSWYSGISLDDVGKHTVEVRDAIKSRAKGKLIIKEWPTKRATVETIRGHIQRLRQTKGISFDAIIVDYPDLLRSTRSYGEKRHELEGNYEELRGLAQEENAIMIVADQTNRGGLDQELVTIANIAEAYSKATVCDAIFTVSRTQEDKVNGTGKLYIAKSRLGPDGIVLPFLLNTKSNVRVTVLDQELDPISAMIQTQGEEGVKNMLAKRAAELREKKRKAGGGGDDSSN